MGFTSLEVFHHRKLRPGEALSLFVHELKKLLEQAMPELESTARQQLLLHQFLAGLPATVSKQLRASGDTKEIDDVVERARLLMALEDQEQATAVVSSAEASEVRQLKDKISELTEQVAALASMRAKQEQQRSFPRCFSCNRLGHTQRYCPSRRRCFACGQTGHLARDCQRSGNANGSPVQGRRRPSPQY